MRRYSDPTGAILLGSPRARAPSSPILEPSKDLYAIPLLDEELVDYGTHDDDVDNVVSGPNKVAISSAANLDFSTRDHSTKAPF